MSGESIELSSFLVLAALAIIAVVEFAFFDYESTRRDLSEHRMMTVGIVVYVATLLLLRPLSVLGWAHVGGRFAPTEWVRLEDWQLWPLALLTYEFFYWLHHWVGHKVRIFWCVHSPHHAPNSINMLVSFNHSIFESVLYLPIAVGFLTALAGVDPLLVAALNVLDIAWGSLLHLSDNLARSRFGFLERFMQTPSYHRAHHAKNLEYMDMNYTSITLFWDTVFGTKIALDDENPATYGITSEVDTGSYLDTHFGPFRDLWNDIRSAPGVAAKLGYIFMPPGWSHTGDHATVAAQKRALASKEPVRI